jgi:hypothetical protein
MAPAPSPGGERWWSLEEGRQHIVEQRDAEQRSGNTYGQAQTDNDDEFPRIVRSRFRG